MVPACLPGHAARVHPSSGPPALTLRPLTPEDEPQARAACGELALERFDFLPGLDDARDFADYLEELARDAAGIDWLVALPSPELTGGKSVFGDVMAAVPSTVLVDAGGHVVWSHRGPLPAGVLARQLASLSEHR